MNRKKMLQKACRLSVTATLYRLDGRIEEALQFEKEIDDLYRQYPQYEEDILTETTDASQATTFRFRE